MLCLLVSNRMSRGVCVCLDYCERKGENANHRDVIFSRTKSKKFPDGDVLLPFLTDFSLLSQAHFSVRLGIPGVRSFSD